MSMVRLHLVGFTPDLKGLVFSGRRGGRAGTYWVPADAAFADALEQLERTRAEAAAAKTRDRPNTGRGSRTGRSDGDATLSVTDFFGAREPSVTDTQDLPLPRTPPRPESKLTPREIQRLLREGRSVKSVAEQAGVEQAWVERFMGPVRHEMGGIIGRTRDSYQTRSRRGPSGLPIGQAVERNLVSRKATAQTLDEVTQGWEARRLRPRTWRVKLRFVHRGAKRSAEWEFRTDSGEVRPVNELAKELGWWPEGPGIRRRDLLTLVPSEPQAEDGSEPTSPPSPTRRPSRPRAAASRKKAASAGRKAASTRRMPGARKAASGRRSGAVRGTSRSKKGRGAKRR